MTGKKKAGGAERPGGSPPGDATPPDYSGLLADLKARIGQARMRAALSVNRELVLLCWSIGRDISARQTHGGWGAKVIDRLARDLARDFPGMSGSSARNLKYMRAFAEAWPESQHSLKPNRFRPLRAPRPGPHQFPTHPARRAIRTRPADSEGPLQF